MQRKGPLPGKIFAWCILQRRFAGHFEYMGSISCQNQLILDAWRRYLATKGRFYRLRLLQECVRVIFCQEFTSSSVRKCSSKMLRPGPFVCAGERKVVSAVFCPRRSTASVPWGSGRCGAAEFRVLDVAVDAMAAEQAEHEQVQVRARARMPLLPPVLRGFGGRLAHRVLHGVDVLGHCVKRGVGERLGRHVKKDFVERYCHGASSLRALTAAMRIARKRNRSPQNGAGRDDGSSQRSLLW